MAKKSGITKGKSHKEGGIPMTVKSTGQKIEVEGGEGIVNKYAMSNTDTFQFEGKEKTSCEIISDLNQKKGDGVSFECDTVENKKYKFKKGGKLNFTTSEDFYSRMEKTIKEAYEFLNQYEYKHSRYDSPKLAVNVKLYNVNYDIDAALETYQNRKGNFDMDKMRYVKKDLYLDEQWVYEQYNRFLDDTLYFFKEELLEDFGDVLKDKQIYQEGRSGGWLVFNDDGELSEMVDELESILNNNFAEDGELVGNDRWGYDMEPVTFKEFKEEGEYDDAIYYAERIKYLLADYENVVEDIKKAHKNIPDNWKAFLDEKVDEHISENKKRYKIFTEDDPDFAKGGMVEVEVYYNKDGTPKGVWRKGYQGSNNMKKKIMSVPKLDWEKGKINSKNILNYAKGGFLSRLFGGKPKKSETSKKLRRYNHTYIISDKKGKPIIKGDSSSGGATSRKEAHDKLKKSLQDNIDSGYYEDGDKIEIFTPKQYKESKYFKKGYAKGGKTSDVLEKIAKFNDVSVKAIKEIIKDKELKSYFSWDIQDDINRKDWESVEFELQTYFDTYDIDEANMSDYDKDYWKDYLITNRKKYVKEYDGYSFWTPTFNKEANSTTYAKGGRLRLINDTEYDLLTARDELLELGDDDFIEMEEKKSGNDWNEDIASYDDTFEAYDDLYVTFINRLEQKYGYTIAYDGDYAKGGETAEISNYGDLKKEINKLDKKQLKYQVGVENEDTKEYNPIEKISDLNHGPTLEYAKGGKLMDYEISYGDKKYTIPRHQTHKMYKAKSDKEALKKIDEMEKEGFMVDEINNRTTDKAIYNTDLGIGLRKGIDYAKGGVAKNEIVEKDFPKNAENITKDELHEHFDLNNDGKVTLEEYAEHIDYHCKNPEVLDEELEQAGYKRMFMYAKGGKTDKVSKYKVLRNYAYGWDDGFFSGDNGEVPTLFDSKKEAEDDIKEHIEDIKSAIKSGNMDEDSLEVREDFKIVPSTDRSYAKGGKINTFNSEKDYENYLRKEGKPFDSVVIDKEEFIQDFYDRSGNTMTYRSKYGNQLEIENEDRYEYGFGDSNVYINEGMYTPFDEEGNFAKGGEVKYLSDYINDKNSKLFKETGTFFAFSNEQFKEQMKEGKKYVDMGGGMITEKGNEEKLVKGLNKNYKEGIKQDLKENGKEKVILRELRNHEAFYTGDIEETVETLKDYPGIKTEDIMKSYRKNYSKYSDFAKGGKLGKDGDIGITEEQYKEYEEMVNNPRGMSNVSRKTNPLFLASGTGYPLAEYYSDKPLTKKQKLNLMHRLESDGTEIVSDWDAQRLENLDLGEGDENGVTKDMKNLSKDVSKYSPKFPRPHKRLEYLELHTNYPPYAKGGKIRRKYYTYDIKGDKVHIYQQNKEDENSFDSIEQIIIQLKKEGHKEKDFVVLKKDGKFAKGGYVWVETDNIMDVEDFEEDGEVEFGSYEDMMDSLDEWNDQLDTNYTTIKEFNDGEEYRRIMTIKEFEEYKKDWLKDEGYAKGGATESCSKCGGEGEIEIKNNFDDGRGDYVWEDCDECEDENRGIVVRTKNASRGDIQELEEYLEKRSWGVKKEEDEGSYMPKMIISTTNVSREEIGQLQDYLRDESWDYNDYNPGGSYEGIKAKGGSIGSGAYVLSLFEDAHDKVREDGFDDMDAYTEDLNERGLGYAEYDEGKYGAAEGFYTHDNDIVEELASDGIAFKTYSGNYAKGGRVMSIERLAQKLERAYPDIRMRENEDSISVFEDFPNDRRGDSIADYYSESEDRVFGMVNHFDNFLKRNGYWAEWVNPEHFKIYKLDNFAKGGSVEKKRYFIDEYSTQNKRKPFDYVEITDDFDELVKKITKKARDEKISYIEFYYKDSFIGSINENNDYKFKIGRGYVDNPLESKSSYINKQKSFAKGGSIKDMSFGEFYDYLNQNDLGYWDNVNSEEIVRMYIDDMNNKGVNVSHIEEVLENNPSRQELYEIWLGNSMETPTPINTKEDLLEALDLDKKDYFAKGGEIVKSIDEFKKRGKSYVNVDGHRMIDWEDDFENYIYDRIDLDERQKIREDWSRKEKENRAKGIKGGKEMRWEEYLLKEVNKKSYAKGGSVSSDLEVTSIKYQETRRGISYIAQTNKKGVKIVNDGFGGATFVEGVNAKNYRDLTEHNLERLIDDYESKNYAKGGSVRLSDGSFPKTTLVANVIFSRNHKNSKINTTFGEKTENGLRAMINNDSYSSKEVAKSIFEYNEKNGKIETAFGNKTLEGLTALIQGVRDNTFAKGGSFPRRKLKEYIVEVLIDEEIDLGTNVFAFDENSAIRIAEDIIREQPEYEDSTIDIVEVKKYAKGGNTPKFRVNQIPARVIGYEGTDKYWVIDAKSGDIKLKGDKRQCDALCKKLNSQDYAKGGLIKVYAVDVDTIHDQYRYGLHFDTYENALKVYNEITSKDTYNNEPLDNVQLVEVYDYDFGQGDYSTLLSKHYDIEYAKGGKVVKVSEIKKRFEDYTDEELQLYNGDNEETLKDWNREDSIYGAVVIDINELEDEGIEIQDDIDYYAKGGFISYEGTLFNPKNIEKHKTKNEAEQRAEKLKGERGVISIEQFELQNKYAKGGTAKKTDVIRKQLTTDSVYELGDLAFRFEDYDTFKEYDLNTHGYNSVRAGSYGNNIGYGEVDHFGEGDDGWYDEELDAYISNDQKVALMYTDIDGDGYDVAVIEYLEPLKEIKIKNK